MTRQQFRTEFIPVAPRHGEVGIRSTVCTLAEGSYFHGVAALLNSLVRAGFVGDFVVGYRGPLPRWVDDLERDTSGGGLRAAPGVTLRLAEMPSAWHLNNLKPKLLTSVLDEICPQTDVVYYFDTDIVVTCPWHTLARWSREGVVLVLDVSNTFMPPQHVYRRAWQRLAASRGYRFREVTGYYNGGCIGLSRENVAFAEVWADLMDGLELEGIDMSRIKYEGGLPEFSAMDQDILNAAIMASSVPVAALGCEAMGIYPRRGVVMPHAMFDKKPWVRPYVLDALRGIPPGRAHLAYWQYVDGPVRPFGRVALARKRLSVAVARFIGLLHVRISRDL